MENEDEMICVTDILKLSEEWRAQEILHLTLRIKIRESIVSSYYHKLDSVLINIFETNRSDESNQFCNVTFYDELTFKNTLNSYTSCVITHES